MSATYRHVLAMFDIADGDFDIVDSSIQLLNNNTQYAMSNINVLTIIIRNMP